MILGSLELFAVLVLFLLQVNVIDYTCGYRIYSRSATKHVVKNCGKVGSGFIVLSEIMKEVRMPWFCPKCKSVMKKRLDERMWYLHGHCFNCQITMENRMIIDENLYS